MTTTSQTFIIPEQNLNGLMEKIGALNKKCRKLKVPEIAHLIEPGYFLAEYERRTVEPGSNTQPIWKRVDDPQVTLPQFTDMWKPTGRMRQYICITLTGEAPKYAGWSLVGVLEPLALDNGERENLIKTVPGCSVHPEYRNRVGECDHCNTRRNRNETFVVQNDAGEQKMIGRQCLKDFLGHKDPHQIAQQATILWDLGALAASAESDDWLSGGTSTPDCWSLDHFLLVTAAVIKDRGWISRSSAFDKGLAGQATADWVLFYMRPTPKTYRSKEEQYWLDTIEELTKDSKLKRDVQKAMEWGSKLKEEEIVGGDYLYNVNLLCRCGYVKAGSAGIAASILIAAQKAHAVELENNRRLKKPESNYIGQPGERVTLKVFVDKVIPTESLYGTTGIHKMTSEDGDDVTWFASATTEWLQQGFEYLIQCRIKAHQDYKGRKQTVITHVKKKQEFEPSKVETDAN